MAGTFGSGNGPLIDTLLEQALVRSSSVLSETLRSLSCSSVSESSKITALEKSMGSSSESSILSAHKRFVGRLASLAPPREHDLELFLGLRLALLRERGSLLLVLLKLALLRESFPSCLCDARLRSCGWRSHRPRVSLSG